MKVKLELTNKARASSDDCYERHDLELRSLLHHGLNLKDPDTHGAVCHRVTTDLPCSPWFLFKEALSLHVGLTHCVLGHLNMWR